MSLFSLLIRDLYRAYRERRQPFLQQVLPVGRAHKLHLHIALDLEEDVKRNIEALRRKEQPNA